MWSRPRLVKAAAVNLHAIEAALVEAVRGGFEGEVRDAFRSQAGERLVERDGIGRGERAVDGAGGLDDAHGAERRGLAAERGEDLAREIRHRGLAAGAGDGHGDGRLRAVESGGQQRQRAARVGGAQDGHGEGGRELGLGIDEHGDGALRHRVGDEARAIGLGARKRGEQHAGRGLAAVGGEAGDRQPLGTRRGGGFRVPVVLRAVSPVPALA